MPIAERDVNQTRGQAMPAQQSRQHLEPRSSEHGPHPRERSVPVDGIFIVDFVVIAAVGEQLTGVISRGGH